MGSPLGKYGQIVAAVVAVGIIGTYLFVLAIAPMFGAVPEANINALDKLAFLAAGAVFGAAAAVNGVKAPIDSAHSRIDKLETATGVPTHGAYPAAVDDQALDRAARSKADSPVDGGPAAGG